MKRVFQTLLILAAVTLLFAPAAVAQMDGPAEVVIALTDDPPSGDPHKARGSNGGHLLFNLYEGLVELSGDMEDVFPALATDWENLDDQTWRFTLRQGVTFHNGETFTAEAVRYSIERLLDPDAVRLNSAFTIIDEVEVVDDYTVIIRTKVPDPIFLPRMTSLHMVPPGYTSSVSEEEFGQNPVGTGPYQLVQWRRGQELALEVFEDYWGEHPSVDRLIFKPVPEASTRLAELRAGTADIIVGLNYDEIEALEQDPDLRVEANSGRRTVFINTDRLPGAPAELDDPRVRQAMNHAIDRQLIIDTILSGYGTPLATIYRPDFFGYDPSLEPFAFDPDLARQLLSDAGYPDGFEIGMQTSESIINKGLEVSEAIVAMLGDVGIRVNLLPISLQAMRETIINGQEDRKNEPLWMWNWGSPLPDADSPLNGLLLTDGISSFYSEPEMDELINAARGEMDVEQRTEISHRIQEKLYQDPPMIYLYLQLDVYGVNDRLEWTARKDEYVLGKDITVR